MGTRIRGRATPPAPTPADDITRDLIPGERVCKPRPGEPTFTLLAHDACAPETVRDWARRAAKAGSNAQKIGDAMLDAEAMEAWQRAYGCKVPD